MGWRGAFHFCGLCGGYEIAWSVVRNHIGRIPRKGPWWRRWCHKHGGTKFGIPWTSSTGHADPLDPVKVRIQLERGVDRMASPSSSHSTLEHFNYIPLSSARRRVESALQLHHVGSTVEAEADLQQAHPRPHRAQTR